MTKKDFMQNLFKLSAILDGNLTDPKAEIYWEILKEYADEEIKKAIISALKTCKFFPKPAEIIELIEGDKTDKSLLAWVKVKNAIERIGSYQSVIFDDPIIHVVIDILGGWQKICLTLIDDMKWVQKDFERLYQVYQNQPLGEYPSRLIGIHEQTNREKGHVDFIPKPIRVGQGELIENHGKTARESIKDSREQTKSIT